MKNRGYNKELVNKYIEGKKKFFQTESDLAGDFINTNLKNFIKDKSVLDAGCGDGENSNLYLSFGAKNVIGIDASQDMIHVAKNLENNDLKFIVGDISYLPFADESFDIIVSRHALHYLDNLDDFYKEANRVLKPGGKIIFIMSHPLADFIRKKGSYRNAENTTISLYYNKVNITYPTHIFGDVLSEYFLSKFELNKFYEQDTNDERITLFNAIFRKIMKTFGFYTKEFPNVLGIEATKKVK